MCKSEINENAANLTDRASILATLSKEQRSAIEDAHIDASAWLADLATVLKSMDGESYSLGHFLDVALSKSSMDFMNILERDC